MIKTQVSIHINIDEELWVNFKWQCKKEKKLVKVELQKIIESELAKCPMN